MSEVTGSEEFGKLNDTWMLMREKKWLLRVSHQEKLKHVKKGPKLVQVNSHVKIMLEVGKKTKLKEKGAFPKLKVTQSTKG